mmetsp:Transcript_18243/g.44794  ORF Transcript_18243/g.44794 Transcript_18243/m.44794 type:complete len:258 (-) Transcript_18243:1490-2263(-)
MRCECFRRLMEINKRVTIPLWMVVSVCAKMLHKNQNVPTPRGTPKHACYFQVAKYHPLLRKKKGPKRQEGPFLERSKGKMPLTRIPPCTTDRPRLGVFLASRDEFPERCTPRLRHHGCLAQNHHLGLPLKDLGVHALRTADERLADFHHRGRQMDGTPHHLKRDVGPVHGHGHGNGRPVCCHGHGHGRLLHHFHRRRDQVLCEALIHVECGDEIRVNHIELRDDISEIRELSLLGLESVCDGGVCLVEPRAHVCLQL